MDVCYADPHSQPAPVEAYNPIYRVGCGHRRHPLGPGGLVSHGLAVVHCLIRRRLDSFLEEGRRAGIGMLHFSRVFFYVEDIVFPLLSPSSIIVANFLDFIPCTHHNYCTFIYYPSFTNCLFIQWRGICTLYTVLVIVSYLRLLLDTSESLH